MTNEQREALLAGKPTQVAVDITKHKDWQAWQGALTEQCNYGASDNEILEVLAPLIFASGRDAAQAEITVLKQRVADAQDDADELRNQIYYLEKGDSLSLFARFKRLIVRGE